MYLILNFKLYISQDSPVRRTNKRGVCVCINKILARILLFFSRILFNEIIVCVTFGICFSLCVILWTFIQVVA